MQNCHHVNPPEDKIYSLSYLKKWLKQQNCLALAKRLGIHQMTLYRLKAGTYDPRYSTLKKLNDICVEKENT